MKTATKEKTELSLTFDNDSTATEKATDNSVSQATKDIFGPGANPSRRYLSSYEQVAEYSNFLKGLGLKVVYTPGVWDLPHIGHCRYLQKAKQLGDILIVGTELDEAVSIRKGPQRPVVPFNERVEMLCHIRHVDLVVPIPDYDKRGLSGMEMVEAIRPNVFIVSKRSFGESSDTDKWVERAKELSDEVVILDSQAETSTSAKIRGLMMDLSEYAKLAVDKAQVSAAKAIEKAFSDVRDQIDEVVKRA